MRRASGEPGEVFPALGRRIATIFLTVVLGGFAGAAAVLLLSPSLKPRVETRVDGRTLLQWARSLDDPTRADQSDLAFLAIPKFGAADASATFAAHLDSPNPDTAHRSVAELVKLKGAAVPALHAALAAKSPLTRANAVSALRQIGVASAPAAADIAPLIADPVAGGAATQYFVDFGSPAVAVDVALRLLDSGDSTQRHNAMRVLRRAPSDARAIDAMIAAVRGTDVAVRDEAFHGLCDVPGPSKQVVAVVATGLSNPLWRQRARAVLQALGSASAGDVADLAKHPDPAVRAEAASLLVVLARNDPPVADRLVPFIHDAEGTVAEVASRGLLPIWSKDVNLLRQQLRSPAPHVRRFAALGLLSVRPWLLAEIVALLDDPDPGVRAAGERVASEACRDLDAIAIAAQTSDPIERARMIRLTAFTRDNRRLDVMLDAMQDGDLNVRRAAVAALAQTLSSTRATDRLIDALKHDASPTLRSDAAAALASARASARVARALEAAESDADPAVAAAARAARRQGRALR